MNESKKKTLSTKQNKNPFEQILDKEWPDWREYQMFLIYHFIGQQAVNSFLSYSLIESYKSNPDKYVLIGYFLAENLFDLSNHPVRRAFLWNIVLQTMFVQGF